MQEVHVAGFDPPLADIVASTHDPRPTPSTRSGSRVLAGRGLHVFEGPVVTNYVFIIGNGFSRGVDARYDVAALTESIRQRLVAQGDWGFVSALVDAMTPEMPGGVPNPTFEDFAGAMDRASDVVRYIQQLPTVGPASVMALKEASATLRNEVTRIVGAALLTVDQIIETPDPTAPATPDERREKARAFGRELWSLKSAGHRVTVYTLNYDTLLMHGLLATAEDHGQQYVYDGFRGGGPLNDPLDRWQELALYSLHGSLTWATTTTGGTSKRTAEEVRHEEILQSWAQGDSATWGIPAVVLGNRKQQASLAKPFSLMYEQLETDLLSANRVIVAGYGFGDLPLNRRLGLSMDAVPTLHLEVWSPSAAHQLPTRLVTLQAASGTPAATMEPRASAHDISLPAGAGMPERFVALT
jgi:hypothetical protein